MYPKILEDLTIFQTRGVGFAFTLSAEKVSRRQTRLRKIRFNVREASCVALSRNIRS